MAYEFILVDPSSGARRLATVAEVIALVGGGGAGTLAATLAMGNNANALQIKNLADPTLAQDADTLAARDAAIALVDLSSVLEAGNNAGENDITNIAFITASGIFVDIIDSAVGGDITVSRALNLGANMLSAAQVETPTITSPGGPITLDGPVDVNNNQIANVQTPTNAADAVNKNYVDANFLTNATGFTGTVTVLTALPNVFSTLTFVSGQLISVV